MSDDGPGALSGRLPAWAIAAVLGLAYVILAPASSDLAAAAYRSNLFSRAGFTLWDNSWYGGHHVPAYSVLAPALGVWIGPQLLAALSILVATALFPLLAKGHFPARATRVASAWFALGVSVQLLSNRVPFDLGLALGLGALVSARAPRERYLLRGVALALAMLCALASPIAGAFVALAALAWALAGPLRAWPIGLTLAALAPIALLGIAFPEGGTQPFAATAFYPALLGVLTIAALLLRARRERAGPSLDAAPRVLLSGTWLYCLALLGAFLVPSPVGGNAGRLGSLFAGPLLACLLAARRPRLLLVLAPFFLYWQVIAPITDFSAAAADPSVHASYYTPLLGELRTLGVGYGRRPARIEVVPTRNHWEARWLAPHVMLARGWERQLDRNRNALFYDEPPSALGPARYRAWLAEQSVSFVALGDAPLDYSARGEARLARGADVPYLHEIWHSKHWRLFAVLDPQPLAHAPAVLVSLTSDSFTLSAPRPASTLVRIRFTPYWAVLSGEGCVRQGPGGWTEVQARSTARLQIGIDFSLARVFDHGPRCS